MADPGPAPAKKPSIVASAAGGAAGGAAIGPEGAAGGAVLGAITGAKAKKAWKKGQPTTGPQRALVAEFVICILILALSPLASKANEVTPRAWIKRGSAMCGVFLLLGLVSSVGPKTARAAVAFGALVTLVLLVDQRSIFAVLADRFKSDDPPNGLADAAEGVAGIAGDVVDQVRANDRAADQATGDQFGRAVAGPLGDLARVLGQPDPSAGVNRTYPFQRPGVPRNQGSK